MTTDEESKVSDFSVGTGSGAQRKNAEGKRTLSEETISKISKFALKYSDGIEEADTLQNDLEKLLLKIVSYCSSEEDGKLFRVSSGVVDVFVVPVLGERLSVTVKIKEREIKEQFICGILHDEVERRFIKLLD